MKTLLIFTLLFTISASANGLLTPEIQQNVPDTVYIPSGNTTVDNSQIVFEGNLTSSCYKTGFLFQKVDHQNKAIYFEDTIHYFDFEACLRVVTPFMKEPRLGALEQGSYKVFFKNQDQQWVEKGEITVQPATVANFDANVYAPVSHVNFVRKNQNSSSKLIILGQFSNECMEIDKVEMSQDTNQNIVTIKPIVKISDQINCSLSNEPISYRQEIDLSSFQEGRYLFRVKTLNGRVVNKLISIW